MDFEQRERWVNVQTDTLQPGDLEKIKAQYQGVLAILDWEAPSHALLDQLQTAGIPIKMLRFTQDPQGWWGFPDQWIAKCPLATFANEPDIEPETSWQTPSENKWHDKGGKLVCPALHKDLSGQSVVGYDYVGVHCYAQDFSNLQTAFDNEPTKDFIITEYAHQFNQQFVFAETWEIKWPVAYFIWRWKGGQPGYNLVDVVQENLLPTPNGSLSVQAEGWNASNTLGPQKVGTMPDDGSKVQEPDQGWTKACWAYIVAGEFEGAGVLTVSAPDIYNYIKGTPLVGVGEPATFDELKRAVIYAAQKNSVSIQWYQDGYAYDPMTVAQLVRDKWRTIAGVWMQDLVSGQNYYHFLGLRYFVFDINGKPYIEVADTYRNEDRGPDIYTWETMVRAMEDNWTGPFGADAMAFKVIK